MYFIVALLIVLLVIVVEASAAVASLATAFCWLSALCIWGLAVCLLVSIIKTFIAGVDSDYDGSSSIIDLVYYGGKIIGTIFLLMVFMKWPSASQI